MNDLGLDLVEVGKWFVHDQDTPYVLVRISEEHANALTDHLGLALRRCYITDTLLTRSSAAHNELQQTVIAAQLPDPGATMAGDFGEILVYLYQGTLPHPQVPLGVPKWRLKQDRKKPAPHSDVVHLLLPSWPRSTEGDAIFCAEVKTKSTPGQSCPIKDSISDSQKDQTSRLTRTLVWLRERALKEDLGDVRVEHLDRFIRATDHPPAQKHFRAVAVVSADLLDAELADAPIAPSTEYTVAVISVPRLRQVYTSSFVRASQATVPEAVATPV